MPEGSAGGWPDLMTVEQVAAYLQVHRMTVYRYIRTGRIAAVRVGRVYRVRRADLEAFLDRHRTRPSAPLRRQPDLPAAVGREEPVRAPGRDRMVLSLNPLEWVLQSLH